MIRRRKPYRRAFREYAPTAPCEGCGRLTSRGYCNAQCQREAAEKRRRCAMAEVRKVSA